MSATGTNDADGRATRHRIGSSRPPTGMVGRIGVPECGEDGRVAIQAVVWDNQEEPYVVFITSVEFRSINVVDSNSVPIQNVRFVVVEKQTRQQVRAGLIGVEHGVHTDDVADGHLSRTKAVRKHLFDGGSVRQGATRLRATGLGTRRPVSETADIPTEDRGFGSTDADSSTPHAVYRTSLTAALRKPPP